MQETVKKSSLVAEDTFDYIKIADKAWGLIPCTFEESLEEVTFTYDLSDMKALSDIEEEGQERKLQFLINLEKLYKVCEQYFFSMDEQNIYYDENLMPYVKARDVYGRERKPDEEEFLYSYKCIAGGILSKKYNIGQVLGSGPEILSKEKNLQPIIETTDRTELVDCLKTQKNEFLEKKSKTIREVSKRSYLIWRIVAVLMLITGLICSGLSIYYGAFQVPRQKALVAANQRFITRDYVGCIDSIEQIPVEDMDLYTKYILAVSYASTESFKQEEISNIVSGLSINSNEKELEYWINLGRLQVRQAENLAMTLSDDKLLIYAYMKEMDMLENDTDMDGEEKKSRLDTLQNEIENLGEKYKADEE